MSVLYVIANWSENFENNRTRELKNLAWVPMPNRHDGDGYTELMDHPKAAAHYGAWCAIVQVASKCDPRGTLVRDGQKPHDSRSLSRITRIPEAVFNEAIPRLLEIGWLNAVTSMHDTSYEMSQEGATLGPHLVAVSSHLPALNGMEWNGIEQKEKKGSAAAMPQLPAGLSTAAFATAWKRWIAHRKEIKKKLTPTTAASQLKRLEGMGHDAAIATIEHTIERGWIGLVTPEGVASASRVATGDDLLNWSPEGDG